MKKALQKYNEDIQVEVLLLGRKPAEILDAMMEKHDFAKGTVAAATKEHLLPFIKIALQSYIKKQFQKPAHEDQSEFYGIEASFHPQVKKLTSLTHFVPSKDEHIHIKVLIDHPSLLNILF